MNEKDLGYKKEALIRDLEGRGSLLVAFSGGVDSTFLLATARDALGERVVAVTARSLTHPSGEWEEAAKFAQQRGIAHIVFQSDEFSIPDFVSNGPERCYHCKKTISEKMLSMAREKGIPYVAHGANLDDMKDYRPGLRAAREMGIIAPLVDAGLNKAEIRRLSKEMSLPTWDKPAMACLASRIPYGTPITHEKLRMVADAEAFLQRNGFRQYRVRHHGSVARIEIEDRDMPKITEPGTRRKIIDTFREIGFLYISVDLEGYVSGSMNRALSINSGVGE